MRAALAHINSWIFDLDNTLYPSSADLFALIDERMGAFIMDLLGCDAVEAKIVQKRYFMEHGTTLSGLMRHHGTDPRRFLDYVHDIAMDRLTIDTELVDHMDIAAKTLSFGHRIGPGRQRQLVDRRHHRVAGQVQYALARATRWCRRSNGLPARACSATPARTPKTSAQGWASHPR